MNRSFLKLFWIPASVYLIGTIFLFPVLRYYIDCADTFSYIAIAEKYHNGNISSAINGFWSPMISWLLSSLLYTKADVFLLFKILDVTLGLTGLFFTASLIEKLGIRRANCFFLLLFFVPCFCSFALLWSTPDLLFLDILLLIHLIFIDFDGLKQSRVYTIGITGAMLFFAKAYGFFYFLAFSVFGYTLIFLHEDDKDQRRRILLNAVKSMLMFLLLSAIWFVPISFKYGHFTLSEGVAYNESISPISNEIIIHPILSNGLSDPRIHNSMFAWEDPSLYKTEYGVLKSPFDFHKKIMTFVRNVSSFYYYQYRNQIGWIFLAALFAAIFFLKGFLKKYSIVLLIFTVLAFPSAYFFVILFDRFIWIITILMGISIIYISNHLIMHQKRWIGWPLAVFCCLLLLKRPLKEILWRTDTSKTFSELTYGLTHFNNTLKDTYRQDAAVFTMTDSLRRRTDLKGIVAGFNSHSDSDDMRESYPLTLTVCYYLHNPFFGQLNRSIIEQKKLEPLLEKKIDFYYVWMHDNLNDELVKAFPLIYENKEAGLRIFKIAQSKNK